MACSRKAAAFMAGVLHGSPSADHPTTHACRSLASFARTTPRVRAEGRGPRRGRTHPEGVTGRGDALDPSAMTKTMNLSLRTVQRIWQTQKLQPHRIISYRDIYICARVREMRWFFGLSLSGDEIGLLLSSQFPP